jgi:hypothetical protein
MESMSVLTQLLDVLDRNQFAAVVLIALVAVLNRRPPKE